MHPIKRAGLIALFSFGTIAGFGHGIASLGQCHQHRREAFEEHVADVCTRSAERVISEQADRDRDRDYDRDYDRDRGHHHHHHQRDFAPYGAPQWGWGPPPSPGYAPQPPAPSAPAPVAAPEEAPIAPDAPAATVAE